MGIGLLEKLLADKVSLSSYLELKKEVKLLKEELAELKKRDIEHIAKEHYDVKDIAKLLHKQPNTITSKYIKNGIIKAYKPAGSKSYIIEAEEFHRIRAGVGKYGPHFLRSI